MVQELDRQVAQTTHTENRGALTRLHTSVHNRSVHRDTGALHRRGILQRDLIRDLVHKHGVQHDAVTEPANVMVRHAIHLVVRAEDVIALQAVVAVAAGVVVVAVANTVTGLEHLDFGANLRHDTHTLVAKHHVGLAVVHVREAQTRVGNVNYHVLGAKLALTALRLDDLAAGAALEHGSEVHLRVRSHLCVVKQLSKAVMSCAMVSSLF